MCVCVCVCVCVFPSTYTTAIYKTELHKRWFIYVSEEPATDKNPQVFNS